MPDNTQPPPLPQEQSTQEQGGVIEFAGEKKKISDFSHGTMIGYKDNNGEWQTLELIGDMEAKDGKLCVKGIEGERQLDQWPIQIFDFNYDAFNQDYIVVGDPSITKDGRVEWNVENTQTEEVIRGVSEEYLISLKKMYDVKKKIENLEQQLRKKITGRQGELKEKRVEAEKALLDMAEELPVEVEEVQTYGKKAIAEFQMKFEILYAKVETSLKAFEEKVQEAEDIEHGEVPEFTKYVETQTELDAKKEFAQEIEKLIGVREAKHIKEKEKGALDAKVEDVRAQVVQWNTRRKALAEDGGWAGLPNNNDRKKAAKKLFDEGKVLKLFKSSESVSGVDGSGDPPDMFASERELDEKSVELTAAEKSAVAEGADKRKADVIEELMTQYKTVDLKDNPDRYVAVMLFNEINKEVNASARRTAKVDPSRIVGKGIQAEFKEADDKEAEQVTAYDNLIASWQEAEVQEIQEGGLDFNKEMNGFTTRIDEIISQIPKEEDGSYSRGAQDILDKAELLKRQLLDDTRFYQNFETALIHFNSMDALAGGSDFWKAKVDSLTKSKPLQEEMNKLRRELVQQYAIYGLNLGRNHELDGVSVDGLQQNLDVFVRRKIADDGDDEMIEHGQTHVNEQARAELDGSAQAERERYKGDGFDITGRDMEGLLVGQREKIFHAVKDIYKSLEVEVVGAKMIKVKEGEVSEEVVAQFAELIDGVPEPNRDWLEARGIKNFDRFKEVWKSQMAKEVAKSYHEAAMDKLQREAASKMYEIGQMAKNFYKDPAGTAEKIAQVLASLGIVGGGVMLAMSFIGPSILAGALAVGVSGVGGGTARHFISKGIGALSEKIGFRKKSKEARAAAVKDSATELILNRMFGVLQNQDVYRENIEGKHFASRFEGMPQFAAIVASAVREFSNTLNKEDVTEENLQQVLGKLSVDERMVYHSALSEIRETNPEESKRLELAQLMHKMRNSMGDSRAQRAFLKSAEGKFGKPVIDLFGALLAPLYGGDAQKGKKTSAGTLGASIATSSAVSLALQSGLATRIKIGAAFGVAAGAKQGAEHVHREERHESKYAIFENMKTLRMGQIADIIDSSAKSPSRDAYIYLKRILHGTANSYEMAGVISSIGNEGQATIDANLYTQIEDAIYTIEREFPPHEENRKKRFAELKDAVSLMAANAAEVKEKKKSKTKVALTKRLLIHGGYMIGGAVIGATKAAVLGLAFDKVKPDQQVQAQPDQEAAGTEATAGEDSETEDSTPESVTVRNELQEVKNLRHVNNVEKFDSEYRIDAEGNRLISQFDMGANNVNGSEERGMRRNLEVINYEGDKQELIREWRQKLGITYDGKGGEIRGHVAHEGAKMAMYLDPDGKPGFKLIGDDSTITRFDTARHISYGDEGTFSEPVAQEPPTDTDIKAAIGPTEENTLQDYKDKVAEHLAEERTFEAGGDKGIASTTVAGASGEAPVDQSDVTVSGRGSDVGKAGLDIHGDFKSVDAARQMPELKTPVFDGVKEPSIASQLAAAADSSEVKGGGTTVEDTGEKVVQSDALIEKNDFELRVASAEEAAQLGDQLRTELTEKLYSEIRWDFESNADESKIEQHMDKYAQAINNVDAPDRYPTNDWLADELEKQGVDHNFLKIGMEPVSPRHPAVVEGGPYMKYVDANNGEEVVYYNPVLTFEGVNADGKVVVSGGEIPDSIKDYAVKAESAGNTATSEIAEPAAAEVPVVEEPIVFGSTRDMANVIDSTHQGEDLNGMRNFAAFLDARSEFMNSDSFEQELQQSGLDISTPAVKEAVNDMRHAHKAAVDHFNTNAGNADVLRVMNKISDFEPGFDERMPNPNDAGALSVFSEDLTNDNAEARELANKELHGHLIKHISDSVKAKSGS